MSKELRRLWTRDSQDIRKRQSRGERAGRHEALGVTGAEGRPRWSGRGGSRRGKRDQTGGLSAREELLAVRSVGVPTAKENAHPFEGQGPHSRVMTFMTVVAVAVIKRLSPGAEVE